MSRCRDRWAFGSAAAALLIALPSPLLAQATNTAAQSTNSATPTPTAPVVGPRELQNFNLGGTVTRPAEPVATPTPVPAPATSRPAPSTERPPSTDERPASSRTAATPPRNSAADSPAPATARPATDDRETQFTAPDPVFAPPASGSGAEAELLPAEDGGSSTWPWLLAALTLAGGGFLLWRRRQRALEPAVAGISHGLVASEPKPAPAPSPVPAPKPSPRRPIDDGGIVSKTLQPKMAFEFKPIRAEVTPAGDATLIYDVIVLNSGSAPARDVLVEAHMVNAGPRQDEEIGYFFRNPVGRGDRVPVIPPMGKVALRSRVVLPADRLVPVDLEGRKLLVPLVAVNALYRGAGGEKQQSASFLVGRGGSDGGKMGPLHLDRGPRSWTGLGVRQHSGGLR